MNLQNMRAQIAHLYKSAVHYFETGDLIPFLVVVSVFHFVGALGKYDIAPVALAVGIGVDVGMYRVVKAALKFGGAWWLAAVAISIMSYGYHVEYYAAAQNAWLLALPLPALIVLLAALSHRENYGAKLARALAQDGTANGTPVAKKARAENATAPTGTPNVPRGTYEQFKMAQLARNGAGPMDAGTVCKTFGVPKRTAYNWLARYHAETLAEAHPGVN